MTSIRIEALTKSYGDLQIFKELSLDIAEGEFIALVGPSGCGKSTILKILAGLEEANSGKIWIGDRDVTDVEPGKRDIAMVFQNYALYPHLTVEKNLSFGLRMRSVPPQIIAERVKFVADILGIEHLLARRPKALSGGQRQRVALGRAIVREPQAFLMDEPLSNLDAALRARMRTEISSLHDRLKVTTVYVTHDQTEAMTMADRIVVLNGGEIQQIATPEEMFARPSNLFVASFMGSPGMNLIRANVDVKGDRRTTSLFGSEIDLTAAPNFATLHTGEFYIGIRPEHLELGGDGLSFEIVPRIIERLGSEQYVYATLPEEHKVGPEVARARADEQADTFIARFMNAPRIPVGEPLPVSFHPSEIHVFDPNTQLAV